MKRRRGAMVWLLCGLSAAAMVALPTGVFAKPGVIKTRDGQTYSGDLDERNEETITVTAGRIPTVIPRDRIASVEYAEDYEKRFRERLGKLDAQDVPGRLQLAREAIDNRQYVLARDAAEAARVIDPNNVEAVELVAAAQNQLRLERLNQQQQQQQPRATAGAGAGTGAGAAATQSIADRLLKPEEINAIRQAELRPDDVGVRVRFDRDVKKRFMEYHALTPQEINAMPVSELVQRILREGTPEMRRDVIIQSDPPALLEYRRNVQPFIVNNCATSGCHGPVNGEKFSLIVPADNDPAVYTNFYILQSYRRKMATSGDNVFGRAQLRMIDRQAPADSMLLQYALPGAIAEFDHPEVHGYRPPFRGLNDARYQQIRNWIAQSLITVPPDYGFEPGAGGEGRGDAAATQPATTQAAPATPSAASAAPAPRPAARPATRAATRPLTPAPTVTPAAAPAAPPPAHPAPQPAPLPPQRTPFQRPAR